MNHKSMKHVLISMAMSVLFLTGCEQIQNAVETAHQEQVDKQELETFIDSVSANAKHTNETFEREGVLSLDLINQTLGGVSNAVDQIDDSQSEEMRNIKQLLQFATQTEKAYLSTYLEKIRFLYPDYSTVDSLDILKGHSQAVHEFLELNHKLRIFYTGEFVALVKAKAKENGWQGAFYHGFITTFEQAQKERKVLVNVIRDTDDDLGKALLMQNAILTEQWGKWQWNAVAGTIDFEEDAAIDSFNQSNEMIQDATRRQRIAQKDFMELMRLPGSR
jgi:hypothetical protein